MTATSTIRWQSFSLHKDGNRPEEYEDAFAGNPKVGRFAIADGATESSFASLWARLLVEGFVASRRERSSVGWLPPLYQRWSEAVDHLELEWFGDEKRRIGAFATFLGLAFRKPRKGKSGRWKAIVVGDCCLFQVREDRLLNAFPITRAEDFGNRPQLLGSRVVPSRDALAEAKQTLGRWKKGDRFFLMTDALAQWFLRQDEEKRRPWESLRQRMGEPDETAALTAHMDQLRHSGELKNDDITLLMIDL